MRADEGSGIHSRVKGGALMALRTGIAAVIAALLAVTLLAAPANAEVRQGTRNCISPRTLFLTVDFTSYGWGKIENTSTGASFPITFSSGISYHGGYVRSAWRVENPTWANFRSVNASCAL